MLEFAHCACTDRRGGELTWVGNRWEGECTPQPCPAEATQTIDEFGVVSCACAARFDPVEGNRPVMCCACVCSCAWVCVVCVCVCACVCVRACARGPYNAL